MATIVRVEALPLRYPEPHDGGKLRHVTLARVETDDGAVGWGECISQPPEAALAVKTLIDRGLGGISWSARTRVTRGGSGASSRATPSGTGAAASSHSPTVRSTWRSGTLRASSGGRRCTPCSGSSSSDFRACASIILDMLDLEHTAEQFADFRARGFTCAKGGWGLVPEAGFGLDENAI